MVDEVFFQQKFKEETLRVAYIDLEHPNRQDFRNDVTDIVGSLTVAGATWDKFFQSEKNKPIWIPSPNSREINDVEVVLQLAAYFLIKGAFKAEDEAWSYVELAGIPSIKFLTLTSMRKYLSKLKVNIRLLPRSAFNELSDIEIEGKKLLRDVLKLIGHKEWNTQKPHEVDQHTHEVHYSLPFSEGVKLKELASEASDRLAERNVQRVSVWTYKPIYCIPSTNFVGLQALLDMSDYGTLLELVLKIDDHFLYVGCDPQTRIELLLLGERATVDQKNPEIIVEIHHRLGTAYRNLANVIPEERGHASYPAQIHLKKAKEASDRCPQKKPSILLSFAALEIDKGNYQKAREFCDELFYLTNDSEIRSRAHFNIAWINFREGRNHVAETDFKTCCELALRSQAQYVAARAMIYLARIAYLDKDSQRGKAFLERTLRLLQEQTSILSTIERANVHSYLAQLYYEQNEEDIAQRHYKNAMALFRTHSPLKAMELKEKMDVFSSLM